MLQHEWVVWRASLFLVVENTVLTIVEDFRYIHDIPVSHVKVTLDIIRPLMQLICKLENSGATDGNDYGVALFAALLLSIFMPRAGISRLVGLYCPQIRRHYITKCYRNLWSRLWNRRLPKRSLPELFRGSVWETDPRKVYGVTKNRLRPILKVDGTGTDLLKPIFVNLRISRNPFDKLCSIIYIESRRWFKSFWAMFRTNRMSVRVTIM